MIDLWQLDSGIRLIAIGAQIMIIAVVAIGPVRSGLKLPLIGLLVGAMAYLINSSTGLAPPNPWRIPIDFLSVSTTVWAWIFALQLFEKQVPKICLILVPAILAIIWVMAYILPAGQLFTYYAIHLLSLGLVLHMLYVAISGRGDDLIEKRRRIRVILPVLVALQVGGVLLYETIYSPFDTSPEISALNASFILVLVLCAGIAVLTSESVIMSVSKELAEDVQPTLNLSPSEKVLNEKLNDAMKEGAYRTPSMTIASLADQLGSPEHRLRALINQKLGHRNFSSFLNGYRINEAKEKLADRELVDLPILTIAMDLGYNSLAPFNRAFRAETGQTPSDFRRSAIDQN